MSTTSLSPELAAQGLPNGALAANGLTNRDVADWHAAQDAAVPALPPPTPAHQERETALESAYFEAQRRRAALEEEQQQVPAARQALIGNGGSADSILDVDRRAAALPSLIAAAQVAEAEAAAQWADHLAEGAQIVLRTCERDEADAAARRDKALAAYEAAERKHQTAARRVALAAREHRAAARVAAESAAARVAAQRALERITQREGLHHD